MLGRQLHIERIKTDTPFKIGFIPNVVNGSFKGLGGFWTSTYDVEKGSDWIQFCMNNDFQVPVNNKWHGYVLYPSSDAKILVIDSYEDLLNTYSKYKIVNSESYILHFLDFEAISRDYDAIHLTKNGQLRTRHTTPSLYGWDCESTHWFRWKFDKVERMEGMVF